MRSSSPLLRRRGKRSNRGQESVPIKLKRCSPAKAGSSGTGSRLGPGRRRETIPPQRHRSSRLLRRLHVRTMFAIGSLTSSTLDASASAAGSAGMGLRERDSSVHFVHFVHFGCRGAVRRGLNPFSTLARHKGGLVRDRGGGGGLPLPPSFFAPANRSPCKIFFGFPQLAMPPDPRRANESGLKAAGRVNGLTRANVVVQPFLNASPP